MIAALSQVILVVDLGISRSQPLLAKRPSKTDSSGLKVISRLSLEPSFHSEEDSNFLIAAVTASTCSLTTLVKALVPSIKPS